MKSILLAFSFLTVLPVGRMFPAEERTLARSMAFFPWVGLVIGGLVSLVQYLLSYLFPKPLVLWGVIGLLCLLTRGLHLDGFADTIDGLASGGTRERVLEVMKDSRIGAFGVIGLILLLGAKYLALDQIPNSSIPHALIMMVVMGRSAMVWVCYRSPYARSAGGLGKPFTEHLRTREMAISSISALVIAFYMMGVKGIAVWAAVVLISFVYRLYFLRRLGGVTGDILGAANELVELCCLLLIILSTPFLRS